VSSPASGAKRIITRLFIFNDDSSSENVRIDLRKASTDYGLYQNATLAADTGVNVITDGRPIVLDDTDESLRITLGTSGDVDIVACYVDET
jgi:hypothetical protein